MPEPQRSASINNTVYEKTWEAEVTLATPPWTQTYLTYDRRICKKKNDTVPVHAMHIYKGVEVKRHSFLTLALDEGE